MKRNKVFIFIASIVILTSCYVGTELPPDQQIWEYSKPSSFGLDDERFLELDDLIRQNNYDFIDGLVILKEDKIIFENYYDLSTREQLRPLGRNTYAVLISLLGSFLEEGWINSLDDPIANYLPEYSDIFTESSAKSNITIRHMLDNRSGLFWNESVVSSLSDRNDINRMNASIDWTRYILERPQEAAPGLRYVFNSGHGMILSKIMENALPDQSLDTYFDERLFQEIGITNYNWEKDPTGTLNGTNGLKLSTFDLVKFGSMIMNQGRWIDRKRVISEDWYFEISNNAELQPQSQYHSFGYGWWRFTSDYFELYNYPSQDILIMTGTLGENMYIIPELDLIIAIQGNNCCNGFFNQSQRLFNRLFDAFRSDTPL
ncbi:MAG: serine hydrolase [Cyclobacteriaceae bacterium]